VPEVRDGTFRVDFFFSFLGRIVSWLCLARRVPLFPAPPAPTPTATWGMELTVSVSTVMFLADPSPDGFPLPAAVAVYAFVGALGRGAAAGGVFALPSLFPPLSLPLSLLVLALTVLLEALSAPLSCSVSGFAAPFALSSGTGPRPRAGVLGKLFSCTVSSVELAPLNPLAGDLVPAMDDTSSPSASGAAGLPFACSEGCGGRWRPIEGGLGSGLRGETTAGLLTGGGDRSLGETGHRGGSLSSVVTDGFWGVGALIVGSEETGCRAGVVAADSRCCAAVEGGLVVVVLEARVGLTSLELFFRDRPGPARGAEAFDLSDGRAGDDSREGMGEVDAEAVRLGWRRLVVAMEEADASRRGFVDAPAGWSSASIGPAVSRVALGAAAEGLSSILGAKGFTSREMFEEEGSGR
jgi:hypothetical protein